MKQSLFAVAAAACFSTTVLAADLPRKAPPYAPPPPPPFSWTGFYAGVHAGWGFSDNSARVSDNFILFDPAFVDGKSNGFVGGGQIGYNWQFTPNWVLGVEGDFSGTDIHSSSSFGMTIGGAPFAPGNNYIFDRNVRWLASIRGRVGYAADRWLLYITGGGAWGQIEHTVGPVFGTTYGAVSGSDTRSGWVIGGGVEYAFTNNWTGRVEYLFYDLGDSTVFNPTAAFPVLGATTTWENKISVIRAGVNYKF